MVPRLTDQTNDCFIINDTHPTQFVYVYTYYGIVNYLKKVSLNVQMNLCKRYLR